MPVNISEGDPKLPKVATAAVVVAFVTAALTLITAVIRPAYLVGAIVPIAAGVTILRRRAWGGYGFALVAVAQGLLILLLQVRSSSMPTSQVFLLVIVEALFGLLFYFAGRALSRVGATTGARWPWIGLALILVVPFLFVRAYLMPTGSMENTLLIGDHIFVRVFPRGIAQRGDLLAFRYPVDHNQIYVKRVIGVAGDRIRMKDRVVYRNGVALKEPYAIRQFPADEKRDNLPIGSRDRGWEGMPGLLAAQTEMMQHHVVNGDVVVPPRKYFVLGDNRDNSLDSRYWGFVDESEVIGKPLLIYYSEAGSGSELGSRPDQGTHTRWGRVLRLL